MTLALLLVAASATADDGPAARCGFEGFAPTFRLLVTTRPTNGWVICLPTEQGHAGCRSSPLRAGEPIVRYRTEGPWTCAALPGGPGWVRSSGLRLVEADPSPSIASWVGTWKGGAGQVTIRRMGAESLTLTGRGTWNGANGVVHHGNFEGTATPLGNTMRVTSDGCEIDMSLIGRYILAEDNNGCGGMNVRFSGLWQRAQSSTH